jgi:hypothetical protein
MGFCSQGKSPKIQHSDSVLRHEPTLKSQPQMGRWHTEAFRNPRKQMEFKMSRISSISFLSATIIAGAMLGFSPAQAETRDVTFKNDGPTAIALTVVDMDAKKPVISGQQIVKHGATVKGPVAFDSKGKGHIKYKVSQATVHDKVEDGFTCQPTEKSAEIGKDPFPIKLVCKKK